MTNSIKPVSAVAVRDVARVLRDAGAGRSHVEDEEIAGRSSATLLITASRRDEVETLARRVHNASARAVRPFVSVRAGALPAEPSMLRKRCSALLDVANGGSLLMTDIEEAPTLVQGAVIEVLAELQCARVPSAAVRLITGTTVCLLDRVALGTFSERLFYRLNVVHVVVGSDAAAALRQ